MMQSVVLDGNLLDRVDDNLLEGEIVGNVIQCVDFDGTCLMKLFVMETKMYL